MLLSPGSFLGGKNHASPSVAAKKQLPLSEEAASRETALLSPCPARRAAAVLPQMSGLEADLHGGTSRATLLASSMCPHWAGVFPLWLREDREGVTGLSWDLQRVPEPPVRTASPRDWKSCFTSVLIQGGLGSCCVGQFTELFPTFHLL